MKDNQAKYPQLRFKGFTDPWEQRKLGELSQKISVGIATSSSKHFSSQDQGVPFIKNQDIKENRINTKNLEYISKEFDNKNKNKRVKQGDIITARTGYPGLSAVVPKELEGAQTFTTLITRPISEMILSEYISIFINSPYGMKQISGMEAGGAQKNVNAGIVQNLLIPLPSLDEQKKISNFILKLDDTIALHQRKLAKLKELKQGYLQKMFPKNGSKFPQLRFAGFADDWEERKLSSGLREYTDRVIVEDDKEYYQISVRNNFGGITLRGSKMGNKIGRKRQAKINLTKYPQTLIFTRQTVEQGGIGWVDKYCDGAIVTENMPTISLDTSVFSKYFLTNLFQTRIFYKNAILDNVEGGSAQIAIHESKFLSSTLLFPNLDEQEKIGQFFKQLDNTIALHQRKLEKLQELKKGYLQKMFC